MHPASGVRLLRRQWIVPIVITVSQITVRNIIAVPISYQSKIAFILTKNSMIESQPLTMKTRFFTDPSGTGVLKLGDSISHSTCYWGEASSNLPYGVETFQSWLLLEIEQKNLRYLHIVPAISQLKVRVVQEIILLKTNESLTKQKYGNRCLFNC
jgi:hypothetical protein